jgi:hypothetical protein
LFISLSINSDYEANIRKIGIVGDRTSAADFDNDMQRAKGLGIDAFALNIGVDGYTDQQLGYAYQSAANNGMKVFISFDFNWYSPTSGASAVGSKIAQYASLPAQLMVNGKVFASSFAGDALDVAAMRAAAGVSVFWAPNFHPGQADFSKIDGALNWLVSVVLNHVSMILAQSFRGLTLLRPGTITGIIKLLQLEAMSQLKMVTHLTFLHSLGSRILLVCFIPVGFLIMID